MGYQTQPDGTQQWSCEGGDPMYSMKFGRRVPYRDKGHDDEREYCHHCWSEQVKRAAREERRDLVQGALMCIVGIPAFLLGLVLVAVAPWASVIVFSVIALTMGGFQHNR